MSVAFVNLQAPWNSSSPSASPSFTPAALNLLLAYAFDASRNNATLGFSGTGSYTQLTPPGNFNDTAGDTHGVAYNPSSANSSQTVTISATGGDNMFGWVAEYSGVTVPPTSSTPSVRTAPGTGTGAVLGSAQNVNTGDVLVALCTNTSGTTDTITPAGGGNNRGSGTIVGGPLSWCWADWAGSGGSITPSFTATNGAADKYIVTQILLSASANLSLDVTRAVINMIARSIAFGFNQPGTPVVAVFSQFPKNPIRNDAQGYQ